MTAVLPHGLVCDRPRGAAMTAADHRRWDKLRADREVLSAAAEWLRARAWRESYAGFKDKDRCFQLAMLLDTMALQVDAIPETVRAEAVRVCWWLLGGSSESVGR